MAGKKFKVTGVCFIPMQVEMIVRSQDAKTAAKVALQEFKKNPRPHLVMGSQDEGCAFDFDPSEITEL